MLEFLIIGLLCLCLTLVDSAKILCVFSAPSISHQVVFQPIWKELSLRGHEVTVITPNPLKDESLVNLTEIDVSSSYSFMKRANIQQSLEKDLSVREVIHNFYILATNVLEHQLSNPEVKVLIKDKSKHFDLVMVEFITPALTAFSARFNCPLIGVRSLGAQVNAHDVVGNPTHPVLYPDFIMAFVEESGFCDRLASTLYITWFRYYHHFYLLPQQDTIVKKYFGEELPYVGDIEKNISMLFLNENPILRSIRPTVPSVIQLGNMHFKSAQPLPKDLQNQLDAAKEGFVYFSLGSNVRSANLPVDVREKIIAALSELPYTVLWKWEEDNLPGQPKNVIVRKWVPQQDVLAHPNIKVFVTQGGLQSIEESISMRVPLVGIPFYVDQPLNVRKITHLGIALSVNIKTLTKVNLKRAIMEVAKNPKYRNKVKEISELASDSPMTGLEKAIWWTEYVIRHKGARHLRSPAIDVPLYKYFLLDVVGFLLGVAIIAIVVLYEIVQLVIMIGRVYPKLVKLKES